MIFPNVLFASEEARGVYRTYKQAQSKRITRQCRRDNNPWLCPVVYLSFGAYVLVPTGLITGSNLALSLGIGAAILAAIGWIVSIDYTHQSKVKTPRYLKRAKKKFEALVEKQQIISVDHGFIELWEQRREAVNLSSDSSAELDWFPELFPAIVRAQDLIVRANRQLAESEAEVYIENIIKTLAEEMDLILDPLAQEQRIIRDDARIMQEVNQAEDQEALRQELNSFRATT